MANCPECDAEITELNFSWLIGNIAASIGDSGRLSYEIRESTDDDDAAEMFSCPCCNAVVATDDVAAEHILLGL